MRYIKTYGINGLLEWHGTVHANGSTMKVDFTNGSTTAFGVAPATFITKDPMTQFMMENSDEFKGGRIHLVRKVELPGCEEEEAVNNPAPEPTPAPEPQNDFNPPAEPAKAQTEPVEETVTDDGKRTVKVADKAEAVEWLKENYPEKEYTSVKLRAKAAFDAACQECGVEFEMANA